MRRQGIDQRPHAGPDRIDRWQSMRPARDGEKVAGGGVFECFGVDRDADALDRLIGQAAGPDGGVDDGRRISRFRGPNSKRGAGAATGPALIEIALERRSDKARCWCKALASLGTVLLLLIVRLIRQAAG